MTDEQGATTAPAASDDEAGDADAKRLDILRRLERGEISVAEAGDRLGELDEVLR
jgi:DNA-binding transcriptional ArsR family regulator